MILNLLCHGVLVVLVVDLEVSVIVLAAPVRHDVEWTRVGSGLGADLILQDVNVEVGGLVNQSEVSIDLCQPIRSVYYLGIQLTLFDQQLLQIDHVELEHQHRGVAARVPHLRDQLLVRQD